MRITRIRVLAAVIVAVAGGVSISLASCGTTPPSVTNHALQQSQRMDVVCFEANTPAGTAIAPIPVSAGNCAPVAANVTASSLQYHLYGLVTQPTLGALAVVDLTSGGVADVDRSSPGVDFVPVGANPTDVAVSPDGAWTFVSSADLNKPAIYAIPNGGAAPDGSVRGPALLGDANGLNTGLPLRLPDLRACALPQVPTRLAIASLGGGSADGGSAGTGYALVAVLEGSSQGQAAVVAIDPAALTSATQGALAPCTSLGAVLGGTVLSAPTIAGPTAPPVPWSDGVPYAATAIIPPVPACEGNVGAPQSDGGAAEASARDDGGTSDDAETSDAADSGGQAAIADAGTSDASEGGVSSLPPGPPHPTSIAMRSDVPILYVADDAVPVIHVIDLSDPTHPVELAPLVATSMVDPSRRVAVGSIAVSPPTRDYKTFLYATDKFPGTIMVYDVTDPATSPRTPLVRPHPELTPLAPPDRLSFASAVADVVFVQHDWPLPSQVDPNHFRQYTGLLCNPNPNARPEAGTFLDNGAYYGVDQAALIQSMYTQGGTVQSFASRLRGIFAFATLSNGTVVTIDVDDWDAPCRRPDPMSIDSVKGSDGTFYSAGVTGALDLTQPDAGPGDLDPYHTPLAYNPGALGDNNASVTLEAFFPVSAPHRPRSTFLLRNDPVSGVHIPNLLSAPQLFSASGSPVAISTTGSSPLLLPAPLPAGYIDPSAFTNPTAGNPNGREPVQATVSFPAADTFDAGAGRSQTSPVGVRVSFDDPTVHQDQDWSVTYEGALPTVGGLAVDIDSTVAHSDPAAYQTLTLSAPGARFCSRGIEDADVGRMRAQAMLASMSQSFSAFTPNGVNGQEENLASWTSDYVEIVDDPLPSTDPYWGQVSSENDCWDGDLADSLAIPADGGIRSGHAQARYDFCAQNFGSVSTPDTYLLRDLPILHAHDDSLVVGAFQVDRGQPRPTTSRVIVGAAASNAPFLRAVRCCFHHSATFKVRTGGEWVALGSAVGLLHQVVKGNDPEGSCVLGCDPRKALMNARSFEVPWWQPTSGGGAPDCTNKPPAVLPQFDRDSPLAMRNPMFSYVMWSACGTAPNAADHTLSTRDLAWKFSMRGGFTPQTVPLASLTAGSAVNPQSTRYIPQLGQLAVVDSEAQGLILIDLNLVAVAHQYF